MSERDKLTKAREEITALIKEKYPDIGVVCMVCGPSNTVELPDGQMVTGVEILQFSNLTEGTTAAVLATALRGRIKDLGKFGEIEAMFTDMVHKSGGNA